MIVQFNLYFCTVMNTKAHHPTTIRTFVPMRSFVPTRRP